MLKIIPEYLYLFVIFSLLGWVLEFVFRSWRRRRFTNPGLLGGPYLPIYGTGAVLLFIASSHLGDSPILVKALIYFVITTGAEFLTGFILEEFFYVRLWDYSKEHFQIKNHVCLTFSLYWVILAFVFEYILLPAALTFYRPSSLIFYPMAGIACLIFVDMVLKFSRLYFSRVQQDRQTDPDDICQDFSRIIEPLLLQPEVAMLSGFRHHRMITRLDHSMEVAWLSYLLARRWSLDCTATVRGALLHDLFLYEWWSEGPRLHGFRHPRICLENARKITFLSKKEEDIILKHMWPLTFFPPRYMESWIVCFVDTYCTMKDYLALVRAWEGIGL